MSVSVCGAEAELSRRRRPGGSGGPAPSPPRRAAHLPRRSVHRHTPARRLVLRARRHSLHTLASPVRRFSLLPNAQFPAPSRRPGPSSTSTTRVSTLSNVLRAISENLWGSRVNLKRIGKRARFGVVGGRTRRAPRSCVEVGGAWPSDGWRSAADAVVRDVCEASRRPPARCSRRSSGACPT